MTALPDQVQHIRLDLIKVDDARARFVNRARVMQLADNIEERGLQSPIILRPDANGTGYQLVCGGHRLSAHSELGRETIPAFVRDLSDEDARLIEVQENLLREDLSVMDRALHMATEKAIYEARNPTAKHGGAPKGDKVRNVANFGPRRFTAEMAEALGCGEDAVQRAMQIAKAITPELREEIAGTPLADNQHQLIALTKVPPPDRAEVVRIMKVKGITKVLDAQRAIASASGDAPVRDREDPEDIWTRKMMALWDTARARAWQQRFLAAVMASPREGESRK